MKNKVNYFRTCSGGVQSVSEEALPLANKTGEIRNKQKLKDKSVLLHAGIISAANQSRYNS